MADTSDFHAYDRDDWTPEERDEWDAVSNEAAQRGERLHPEWARQFGERIATRLHGSTACQRHIAELEAGLAELDGIADKLEHSLTVRRKYRAERDEARAKLAELEQMQRNADDALDAAAAKAGLAPHGCDTADHLADEVLELRAKLAALLDGPRIYLQDGPDAEPSPSVGGTTWCSDRINDSDSEWVRVPEPDPNG